VKALKASTRATTAYAKSIMTLTENEQAFLKYHTYSPPNPLMKINAAFLLRSKKVNKYQRRITGIVEDIERKDRQMSGVMIIDVYDVLKAFDITCPATAHAIKKLLAAGERGHKDKQTDLDEAIQSIQRAKELV
jgi:hypothetical protein